VAGDIVATEDANGTLKTILTRSVTRSQVFGGKVLATATYTLLAVVLFGVTGLLGGAIEVGLHPLVSLSGTTVSVGKAFRLEATGFAVYLLPVFAVAAVGIMLSTLSRNSAGAVVGTLMFSLLLQLTAIVPGLDGLQPYLLPQQFNAWQGLLRDPIDAAPIVRAAWVCGLHVVIALGVAWWSFSRRDVAGG
jgi:ABC-2 type transport system permease protein